MEEMLKSSYNNRQWNSLLSEDCKFLKKKLRQPMKCTKNVIHVHHSMQKCPEKFGKSLSAKIDILSKTPIQKSSKKYRSCSSEIKMPLTVSVKSPVRILRSSLGHNVTLQSKGITIFADKKASKHKQKKTKKKQNAFGKMAPEVSRLISLESTDKAKNDNSTVQCNRKSERRCSNKVTEVSMMSHELRKETVEASNSTMLLQSEQLLENESDNIQLSVTSKTKPVKMPIVTLQTPVESLRSSVTLRSRQLSEKKSDSVQLSIVSKTKHAKLPTASSEKQTPVASSRSSMALRSHQLSEKKSDSVQLSIASKTKPAKLPTAISQKQTPITPSRSSMALRSHQLSEKKSNSVQLPIASKTKRIKNSCKHLSSDQFRMRTPNVQKIKYLKKQTVKSQKRVLEKVSLETFSKSYSGNIPIDDLALSSCQARKAKSDGFQFPGKNTLKRKRFIMDAMKRADEKYEDDIYEFKDFNMFKDIFLDSSESDNSLVMTTPKLGVDLTPIIRSKTPVFKDCFSPAQFALSRKVAEECFYRNKKRKSSSQVASCLIASF